MRFFFLELRLGDWLDLSDSHTVGNRWLVFFGATMAVA
jgi:hypothetical protein